MTELETSQAVLEHLLTGQALSAKQMEQVLRRFFADEWPATAISAMLALLRFRGESPGELVGAVRAIRDAQPCKVTRSNSGKPGDRTTNAHHPQHSVLDTAGTGGDGTRTFNISTATAIVVSACGYQVAKHGNRAVSSQSGSADVLAELGIPLSASHDAVIDVFERIGVAFFFAPVWHPVMKKLAPIRGELKIRTIFNLLGPLLNPANADCQLIGAANLAIARTLRSAAKQLGIRRVLVVVGSDGLDEVTLAGTTTALWSNHGDEFEETWSPATFGLPSSPVSELQITDARESAERIVALFEGRTTLGLNVVLANSAAALKVLGATDDLQEGVRLARAAIESGKAMAKLNAWRTAYPQDISTKS